MADRLADLGRLGWAVAALVVSIAPHLPRMPAWISVLTALCIGWRTMAAARGWKAPWRWLRILMVMAGFGSVVATYGTVNGIEAGSALLVVMMDMKLLETWRRRDFQVLMFIGYFMVLAQLLYEPGIWTLPWMVASVWITTTALMQSVRIDEPLPGTRAARMVARMLFLSVPIMVALFLLFPRVPGPFWAMPSRSGSGTSGLSDEMSPGSINMLSLSDSVAFRVSFEGPVPEPSQRYWRGPVLHHFDGATWREPGRIPSRSAVIEPAGEPVRYRLTMEPHDRPWLLALDYPQFWSARGAFLTFDYQLLSRRPLDQLTAYDVVSFPDATVGTELIGRARWWDLQLPDERNPETVVLGDQLRSRHNTDRALINDALNRFTTEEFVYTLRPPALTGRHPVDEFLFDTRRGFCEHYASAFAVLMRAAGIPARVVTGYQGGELNPLNDKLTVRQSDAHAWAEVWLPDEGWIRVDPTAAVAPDRIELGLVDALPESELVPGRLMRSLPALERLRQRWDAMDAAWNEWVLGYGPDQQIALLRSLGIGDPDWRSLVAVLGVVLAVLLTGLAVWFAWLYRAPKLDETQRLYLRYLRKLARRGARRQPSEGPLTFARRAGSAMPAAAPDIHAITRSYVRLRYEGIDDSGELTALRRMVRSFRP